MGAVAKRPRTLFACALLLAPVLSMPGCQGEGFECGRPVDGTSDVRRCDRSLEICVCATNSCARRVGPAADEANAGAGTDGSPDPAVECESGFRYVEAPFARRAIAGQCVPPIALDPAHDLKHDTPSGTLCPGAELPEPRAGNAGAAGASGSAGESAGGSGGDAAGGTAGESAGGSGGDATGGTAGESAGGSGGTAGEDSGGASGSGGEPGPGGDGASSGNGEGGR
jgi:hypothetical protein